MSLNKVDACISVSRCLLLSFFFFFFSKLSKMSGVLVESLQVVMFPKYLWYKKSRYDVVRVSSDKGLEGFTHQGQVEPDLFVPVEDIVSSTKIDHDASSGVREYDFELRLQNPMRTFVCKVQSANELADWTTNLSKKLWPSLISFLPIDLWRDIANYLDVNSWKAFRLANRKCKSIAWLGRDHIESLICDAIWRLPGNFWTAKMLFRAVMKDETVGKSSELVQAGYAKAHVLFPNLVCKEFSVAFDDKTVMLNEPFEQKLVFQSSTLSVSIPSLSDAFAGVSVALDKDSYTVFEEMSFRVSSPIRHYSAGFIVLPQTWWDEQVVPTTRGDAAVLLHSRVKAFKTSFFSRISEKDSSSSNTFLSAFFPPDQYVIAYAFRPPWCRDVLAIFASAAIKFQVKRHPAWDQLKLVSYTFEQHFLSGELSHPENCPGLYAIYTVILNDQDEVRARRRVVTSFENGLTKFFRVDMGAGTGSRLGIEIEMIAGQAVYCIATFPFQKGE